MKSTGQLLITCTALAWIAGPVWANSAWIERPPSAIQDQLMADARSRRFDRFTLIEAALIAEGITDAKSLQRYARRVQQVTDGLRQKSAAESVAEIHQAMHRELLTGAYRSDCHKLSETLDRGDYNCLTATLLFQHLCRQRGIEAAAVAVPGHVYSEVTAPRRMTIQTTCPDWFDQRRSHEPTRTETHPQRRLSGPGLIAKVYYNLAVAAHEQGRFATARDLLQTCLQLDPADAAARENLLAVINNWALAECAGGEFNRALELLSYGEKLAPTYDRFRTNQLHVYGRWSRQLTAAGKFREALDVLEAGQSRFPRAKFFSEARRAVNSASANAPTASQD